MNTLTPLAPSLTKTNRRNGDSQLGKSRSAAPTFRPSNENLSRVTVTQAERLLAQAMTPKPAAFALSSPRSRATRQQIESALLSLLFVSIAITFGLLMTT